MLTRLIYFLIVLLTSTVSQATEKEPTRIIDIDQSIEHVMPYSTKKVKNHVTEQTNDPCSSGGAVDLGICERNKLKKLEDKMARELSNLISAVKESKDYNRKTIKTINNAQKAWRDYRDKECEIEYSLRTAASTWNATYFAICQKILTEKWIQKLHAHNECVSNLGQGCYSEDSNEGDAPDQETVR